MEEITKEQKQYCPRCRGLMYILEDSEKRIVWVCKNCMHIIKNLK